MKAGKVIKRFFLVLLLLILFVVATGVVLTFIYSDEIKQFAIKQLNSYLNTEVQVKEIDFSIFKKFPNATIILNDVVVKSSQTYNTKDFKLNTDTLLKAQTILLQFDLWDAFHKKYNLRAIQLENVRALLCYDKKGKNNFTILKETPESSSDSFALQLEKLKFIETNVRFLNASNDFELEAYSNDLKLKGDFYKDDFTLSTSGKIGLKKLMIQKVNYLKANEANISVDVKVHNNQFAIKSGSIALGKINLSVSGTYETNDEADAIVLKISGKKQSLADIIKSLPDKYQSYFEGTQADGYVDFSADITGGINYKTSPRIKVNFKLNNGQLTNNATNVKLSNLIINGSFDNGLKQNLESTSFTIDTFYTVMNDSTIQGKFSIFNFSTPLVKLKLQGSLNLAQWKSLFNLDTFQVLQGAVSFNFDYLGKIKNLSNITASDYRNAMVKGFMDIKDAAVQLQNNPYLVQHVNGKFYFHNNDVQTDHASLEVNGSQILLKGFLKNLMAFLMLDNEKLNATAQLNIDKLNLNNWQSDEKNTKGGIALPSNVYLMGDLAINELTYNKLVAKQVRGYIELNPSGLYCSNLQFNTLEGSCVLSGRISMNALHEITLQSEVKFNNINIKKMFQAFDNFGQTFLTDKHLQGKLKADVPFLQMKWDSAMNVIDKDILLDANIEISNGQLIEFEPIYDLADYIELSELKQIKFSTIKNDISIKDRKIIIPNMEVKTNAFNIEVSGEHTFDNQMEYRLKLLLREWLANKAKKNKPENQEFGIEENDGLGSTALYLIIKGTSDKYKITYDSKKMKEQVKESLKKEKQELKTILHEELGFFKKDSAFINQQKKQVEVKKTKFKISWDEDNPEIDKSE
ncbi:MAG: hypothetical protein HPY79_02970 [Bacteroidales bacterium]|nr:hypothetical protein [Bacteroidales bacterium]